jgi:hypothetical protein
MRVKKNKTLSFDISVNNRSYIVNATPYKIATGETRFRVSYNNGPVHIFGWDVNLFQMSEVEEVSDILAPVSRMAIARELEINSKELHHAA